jgi:hypothetical protein
MRWIKGDTKPHIDHGKSKFDNTHLVYLTESGSAGFAIHNSFTVYDTLLLQLVNDALIDN